MKTASSNIRNAHIQLLHKLPKESTKRATLEGYFLPYQELHLLCERWGRHWLDLARYADTSGDAPIPEAHLYRDYVIDSFNDDLPYDAFLVEQIAGDLLVKHDPKNSRPRAHHCDRLYRIGASVQ